jgi:hypothetical protein
MGIVVLGDCGIAENTVMSDGAHLLIPFASCQAEGCIQARRTLALPQLEKLLARLSPGPIDSGDEHTFSLPHERVLAREFGLAAPDGQIPWAAWQVAEAGRETEGAAWAWITPCHWQVATDHIAMRHVQDLGLDATDSQALLAAMRPYFEQDGIALTYDAPTRWLARGEVFRDFATASLDRVVGRHIDEWIPRGPQGKLLRRLQQEMQMLLYTHEINEARTAGGLLPVNSFWVSGTGALPASHAPQPPAGLQITHYLRDAALLGDWDGWAAAWRQIDAKECTRLIQRLERGEPPSLTLCGERNAHTWHSHESGWLRRVTAAFGGKRAATLLDSL